MFRPASKAGMYYMSGAGDGSREVIATLLTGDLVGDDLLGEQLGELAAELGIGFVRRLVRKAARKVMRRRAAAPPAEEPEGGEEAPPEGGGEDTTEGGSMPLQSVRNQLVHDLMGISFLRRGVRAAGKVSQNPAGKLLISTMPGGATALQARQIANAGLKSGALKPSQLKAAGKLTKAGRKGNTKALVKIAAIKKKAATGDPAAEKALDTLKLAHCIQTGKPCRPGGARTSLRQSYNAGLMTIRHRR